MFRRQNLPKPMRDQLGAEIAQLIRSQGNEFRIFLYLSDPAYMLASLLVRVFSTDGLPTGLDTPSLDRRSVYFMAKYLELDGPVERLSAALLLARIIRTEIKEGRLDAQPNGSVRKREYRDDIRGFTIKATTVAPGESEAV